MNLFPLYFGLGIILFLVGFLIYCNYDEKRNIKRYEEEQKKYNDPEYKKKMEEELENSLKIYNSEYRTYNDSSYTSDISFDHTSSRNNDDSLTNIMSPSCPYSIWSWN